MFLRRCVAVIVLMLLGACGPEGINGSAPLPLVGSKHFDAIKVGRIVVPLPEGEWIVMASGTRKTNPVDGSMATANDKVLLIRRATSSSALFAGLITIETNHDTQNIRWLRDSACFQEDWMSVSNYFGSESEQQCLRMAVWNTNFQYSANWHPVDRQAIEWAAANGISLAPTTFLGARYRVVRRSDYLSVIYYRTNDDLGVLLGNWWHPVERQKRPPFEKAYQEFLSWAKAWEARVIAGVEGRLALPSSSLPVVSSQNTRPAPAQ